MSTHRMTNDIEKQTGETLKRKKVIRKRTSGKPKLRSSTPITLPTAQAVIEGITEGRSIKQLSIDLDFCLYSWYKYCEVAPDDIKRSIALAYENQASTMHSRVLDLVDKLENEEIDARAGKVIFESLKWIASKMRPKVYGERIEQHIEHTVDITVALEKARQRVIEMQEIEKGDGAIIENKGV